MAKTKRLTIRLDDDMDKAIFQKCKEVGCTKSEYVESVLRLSVEELDQTEPQSVVGLESKKEPYDVYNRDTGCFSRYRGNGELMFHFKPTEKVNGVLSRYLKRHSP
jgi:hypothetical protein